MIQLPQVTVVGTLTADPDLRYTQNGTAVASVTIAANSRKYNRQSGQYEDGDTTFLRANVWNQLAENLTESVSKGDRVIATGVLKQRNWEDRTGNTRTSFELEVDEIGPALRFATAKATKVSFSGGGRSSKPTDDGWGEQSSIPGW